MKPNLVPPSPRRWLRQAMTAVAALTAVSTTVEASTDYGPAYWRPACNYNSSGYGKRFYVVHDIEGYYWGCISYFQRCSTQASVHYTTNGKKDATSDSAAGEVTQMVRDAYYAWHARCWNGYSLGTEHEGFVSNPAWYTEAQYSASAAITKSKCDKYGMAKDRNHVIGHDQKRIAAWRTWMAASGYGSSFYNCNDHSDPGAYWNWTHYMDLVRGGGAPPPAPSTPSGPSSLTAAAASTSQINLSWVDNSGIETGFKIERGTTTANFAQVATVGANVRTWGNTGLAAGTTYYFRVRAYNTTGNSPYSNTASAATKASVPSAPSGLAGTAVSDTQINLTWVDNSGIETGHRIYRSSDNVNYAKIVSVGANSVSYLDGSVQPNSTYYYRVTAVNPQGESPVSNTATVAIGPRAPTGLTATTGTGDNWNVVSLSWTDNSGGLAGTKIERGTAAAGPFTQISAISAGRSTATDTGLAASTTYYYRVRSYSASANSAYSNVASAGTINPPPVLSAIGNKTALVGGTLAFMAAATDPNGGPVTTVWQTFTGMTVPTANDTVLFHKPANSGTTSSYIDTTLTNYTWVHTASAPFGAGNNALKVGWNFKTGQTDQWIRLNTYNMATAPNPVIALDQKFRVRVHANRQIKLGLGVRETGGTAAYGANGGVTGTIEWVGVTGLSGGQPLPDKTIAANTDTTVEWNIPFEAKLGFTGDGVIAQTPNKGVLEHLVVRGDSGSGGYILWIDDLSVVEANNIAYTLDAGAPAGATVEYRTGKFKWVPTAGQVGVYNITVRATDKLGSQDFETIKVTVLGAGNNPPQLSAIGNKTVDETTALTFTASATEFDPGQTVTYSLGAGAPAGASINSTSGAFSWTPTEAQGPGSYPITVLSTDNGAPAANDSETITVTVNEINNAPSLATIANQTVTEGATVTATASATDGDSPAQTVSYSVEGPQGITINASTGALSWTTDEEDGGKVHQIKVRATDNGSPVMWSERTFTVTVNEANAAPVLALGTKNDVNPFAAFDELDDENIGEHNNTVLFRVPYFSASTTAFLDSTSYTYVTNAYPQGGNISYQALYVRANFKTGTTNPWLRLSTYTSSAWTNTYAYPNPTIDLGQKVRFKIWSDKSLKVALGVRETGTGNPIGFNGGITGPIEWVGATLTGSSPNPSRVVNASNWTTVEFNLPAETITAFPGSGNGVLAGGMGVLEHLAIVPNGGTGIYNMYVDDFETVSSTAASSITVDTGDTVTFTASATDADLPAQDLVFTLTGASPSGAAIDPDTGAFSWKPDPTAASTNVVTVTVTDNGTPAMNASANLTVIVNKVNTPPSLEKMADQVVENGGGTTITFDATAQDADGDTLTFSLISAPAGATINGGTGAFSWTPPAGSSTNVVTIRVTDSGTPALWDEQSVNVIVVAANTAPTLSLGTARATEAVFTFETFTNNTPNEAVLFKKPANSATTLSYVDTAVTNYTRVTTSFPAGNAAAGAKVLTAGWTFKTGTTDYWVRLTTASTTFLPNPTFNASARLKLDIYTDKALKVGLGIRETGTAAENGANGGTTGTIEYVGVGSKIGTTPVPTRTVNAGVWTTLEFDLPNEPVQTMTGNSVLTGGQQVLEHLILKGEGGTGAYTVYVDNLSVVTTTALPGAVSMKAGSTLSFTAGGTDPDPGAGLTYGLDADTADTTTATINETTGAFNWAPVAATSQSITVSVEDSPTNGGIKKSASGTFNVTVGADTLAPQ